jgi:hypothetical protein
MKILFFILFTNTVFGFALGNYRALDKHKKDCKVDTIEDNTDAGNYDFEIDYSYTVEDDNQTQSEPQQDPQQPQQQQQPQESQQQQQPQESQQQSPQQPPQQDPQQQQTYSKATFYFRVGPDVDGCPAVQTFNDGMSYGPCRSDDGSQGVKYTSESKYWAAIANASSRCGEYITVNYNGNSLQLRVMDECPGCGSDNHVDMSLDALIELTGSKENACAINSVQPMITWY